MKITYRGVPLDVVHTPTPPSRDAKYSPDGTTYLYHHWRLRVIAVLNPQNISFEAGDPAGDTPAATAGKAPAETDVNIRHYMMQPRGSLVVEDDAVPANELLRTPKDGFVTDSNNGPVPTHFNIITIYGSKSWLVEFAIEAFVNENHNDPVLLSHRWRIVHDIDQDDFSTITHEGEAIFNVEQLQSLGHFPDQYRGSLFPACPKYFRREPAQIVVSEDGSKLTYRVTDREVGLNQGEVVKDFAKRIEAYQTCGWARGAAGWAAAAASQLYGMGSSFFGNNVSNFASGNVPQLGLSALQNISQAGQNVTQSMTPQFFNTIVCRAWGNRTHSRDDLLVLCTRVCVAKVLPAGAGASYMLTGMSVRVTTDLVGKFVEMTCTKQSGPEQTGLVNGQSQVGLGWLTDWVGGTPAEVPTNPFVYARSLMYDEEIAAPDSPTKKAVTASDVANPIFPNSTASRGTWVGKLFANQLSSMDASKPPDPQSASDLNGTTTDQTP